MLRACLLLPLALLLVARDASADPAADAAPEREPAAARRRYVVAAIGDSLTDPRGGGGYLAYLRKQCPKSRFDNYGKGGQMVNQMRKRFAIDVLGRPRMPGPPKPSYSHVIVFGGVNDLMSDETAKRTPAKITRDLAAMYEAARERGVRVVAVTVAPWGGFGGWYNPSRAAATHEVNRWMASELDAKRVDSVVDAHAVLSCGEAEKLCPTFVPGFGDGLHFNGEGHRVLGRALYEAVFADCA